jgi:hypothetical protein
MMGRTVVVHGSQLTDQVTLEIKNCPVCGIRYAAPSAFFAIKDRDAGGWHCPNGHSLVFIEAEPARLKKELTRTRAQLDQARADANRQRNLADASRAIEPGAARSSHPLAQARRERRVPGRRLPSPFPERAGARQHRAS